MQEMTFRLLPLYIRTTRLLNLTYVRDKEKCRNFWKLCYVPEGASYANCRFGQ